jgi:hypothetical protein
MNGMHGAKRKPLYNKKYINEAKKNVASGDFEQGEFLDEEENISAHNIEIYRHMIKQERIEKEKLARTQGFWSKQEPAGRSIARSSRNNAYPSLVDANHRVDSSMADRRSFELKQELEQIKSMLKDTKKEMSSYKCPTSGQIEQRAYRKGVSKVTKQDFKTPQAIENNEPEIRASIHSI